ncbi:exosortase K [Hymenobacter lapidiphilus]|uniref:Exosortase K n=1 Tax=Hymenobacter lapidiphilus TaxID=2608003 RepID=A0A7Y7PP14_9BACT|nr:exosortase K [Hymenobacter lapidiphilus]NVO31280.1 exosortase K [Hymenobacter lapidiphilus]
MSRIVYLLPYLLLLAAYLIAKLCYAAADTADVRWLLAPNNALVEVLLSSGSEFVPGRGYVHPGLGIVIDKSCAGGNFGLLSVLVLTTTYLWQRGPRPALVLPALLLLSYPLTLFVNAARIAGAVRLGQLLPPALAPGWLHEAQGALVYLFFLVAAYVALRQLLPKTASH